VSINIIYCTVISNCNVTPPNLENMDKYFEGCIGWKRSTNFRWSKNHIILWYYHLRKFTIQRINEVPIIHKTGIPLKPIVSSINSPTNNLEGHLAQILKQKTRRTSSYIINSTEFVKKIKEIKWEEWDILVSFDVVSLFKNIIMILLMLSIFYINNL